MRSRRSLRGGVSRLRNALLAASLWTASAHGWAPDARLETLAGYWKGQVEWAGSKAWLAIELVPADSGRVHGRLTLPAIHGHDFDMGPVRLAGDSLFAGPFAFAWDESTGTMRGALPAGVAPVHPLVVELKRGIALAREPRAPLGAPVRQPQWTFDAGAALWADLAAEGGLVFAGADDGVLHALDARTGRERWRFATGGRLRGRPTVVSSALYLPSDDGWLYRLDARHGRLRWKVRILPDSVVRLPITQPGSKYDFYSSAVTVAGGALFVGTHAGRVLALDPLRGETLWEAGTGGSVLAAPGVEDGRVFVGSFDGRVYALDAADGRTLWTYDTGAPVTSTPVPDAGVVVVGSRSFDLFGLDARTGAVRWNHYLWYSWVESTARIADGVAYVGSSDAATIYAIEARSGALRWETDIHGISWGRPAVTDDRVFVAVRHSPSIGPHEAHLLALDRASGEPVWRYPCERPEGATHRGFGASPAVWRDQVFVGGLDGNVYAFATGDARVRRKAGR